MVKSLLHSLFARKTNRGPAKARAHYRPELDRLEDRNTPSTLLVNDNWFVVTDVGPAGLSAGDTVDNRLDAGADSVTGTFGTTAFADINAAIDASVAGDTVRVLEGTYTGNVTVDQSITLEGANAGISAGVHAGARGPESTIVDGAIIVTADNVTIDGLNIEGGADITGDVAGIFLAAGASEVTIENSVITGEGTGRGILSSFNGDNDNITIRENDIGEWTTGIFNQGNDGVQVLSNVIHDNVAGVANDFATDVLIRANTIVGNDEGIGSFESDLQVDFNNLAGNAVAIANYGGSAIDAANNFWGTVDLDEIEDMVSGDVIIDRPLGGTLTATTQIFVSGDVSLIVDTATGAYTLTLEDGTIYSGTGAKVKNGRLQIHDQTSKGKVDVKTNADGTITINIRGKNKQEFTLESAA